MQRRDFLHTSVAASLAPGAAAQGETALQYFEVAHYQLRNSKANQRGRLVEFLEEHHLPMTKRLKAGPVGYFEVSLGEGTPRVVTVMAYGTWSAIEDQRQARMQDDAWIAARKAFGSGDAPYDRKQVWLLRAFSGMPKLEAPALTEGQAPRVFDLRTYEAETGRDLDEKIRMFDTEEIAIFRRCGINPVFFGRTVYGTRQPNLTYLTWYDNQAARDAAWGTFIKDPDWERIRDLPGWSNAEVVSTVSNLSLRPLPFSPLR